MDVHFISGGTEDLGQASAVPKGIKIVGDFRLCLKMSMKKMTAFIDVPYDRFRGGHVDIRLEIPPAADVPAPQTDEPLYLFE
jgi:hypothetical protein